MKIAVNTRLLLKDKLEGIGVFASETLRRITQNHPEHEFVFLFDRKYSDEFIFSKNITPVVIPPQARHPLLYYIWFEYSVAKALKAINADIFISPDGYLSLNSPVKQLQVIHDLNFEEQSYGIPWHERKYYKTFFPRYAKKATRIATVSEFSKNDISTRYGIDKSKIDVVYNASGAEFKPFEKQIQEEVRKKYSGGAPYFVCVGSINPRKNISNLLVAFDAFKSKNDSPVKVIFAGSKRWWNNEMQTIYETLKHKRDVIFTGRLEQTDLERITASAIASMNVSFYEGFGIPMVEAMNCDVPVIASDRTALPEIASDAALCVNPDSPENIADVMNRIYTDESLRKSLIENGRTRRNFFSWDKTAELLWKSIKKTSGLS
jgi:glycosyltransferase involved in cell wall biosynthesis